MLKIYKTKYEYEAVELAKLDKSLKGFSFKFLDVDLSQKIIDLAESKSLFSENDSYFVKCDKDSSLEFLTIKLLQTCQNSQHLFIFWGKSAEFKKAISDLGFEVVEKKEIATDFFPKELVSAVQSLDKRRAWLALSSELEIKSGEEVYGVVNWALKQMMTVQAMKEFDLKSGVKDFQYRNIKKLLVSKDPKQLEKIYFDFVNTYNTSRTKSIGLSSALEMWVLGW